MKEITIKARDEVLKVNLGDKSFTIPLGSALPVDEILKLSKLKDKGKQSEFMYNFLKKHIPEDIYSTLTVGSLMQIFNAWVDATNEATGISPGES
jgi:hypothetical protein